MRLLLILSLTVGLASAATVEIQNRKECYSLPASNVGDCLNATRAGRTYVGEGRTQASNVESDSAMPVTQSARGEYHTPIAKSLEERSVIAQEKAASAQQNIATALWLQIALALAGIVVTIVVAK